VLAASNVQKQPLQASGAHARAPAVPTQPPEATLSSGGFSAYYVTLTFCTFGFVFTGGSKRLLDGLAPESLMVRKERRKDLLEEEDTLLRELDELPQQEWEQAPVKRPTTVRRYSACDAYGCTALHDAAGRGAAAEAAALLEAGEDADAREAWDETPLHFAARAGSAEVCEMLLSHGAEVNAVNNTGCTALLEAARADKESVCHLLLAHGAHAGGLSDDQLPPLLRALLFAQMLSQGEPAASEPESLASDSDFEPTALE